MIIPLSWKTWALLLLLDALACIIIAAVKRKRRLLVADVAAAAGVLLGVNTFVLLRAFIMDTSQCGPTPAFACLLNSNRGVWTFGAMCVAAATLYVNSRMKQAEEDRAESRRKAQASRAITAALDETVHNLQHFAYEITDDNKFKSFPAITVKALFALTGPELASYCAPTVLSRIRVLQRIAAHNKAMVRSAGEVDGSMKLIGLMDDIGIATFSRSEWLARIRGTIPSPIRSPAGSLQGTDRAAPESPLEAVRLDDRVVTHSVRCVMEMASHHPDSAAHLLREPELRWLETFRSDHDRGMGWWYYGKSSQVTGKEAAEIRAAGVPLYCWINDKPLENVKIVAVCTACQDLAHLSH